MKAWPNAKIRICIIWPSYIAFHFELVYCLARILKMRASPKSLKMKVENWNFWCYFWIISCPFCFLKSAIMGYSKLFFKGRMHQIGIAQVRHDFTYAHFSVRTPLFCVLGRELQKMNEGMVHLHMRLLLNFKTFVKFIKSIWKFLNMNWVIL